MYVKRINTPMELSNIIDLKAGDSVSLSGFIYTARDAAHKRLIELIKIKHALPFNIENQVIYYVGPCPEKPGNVIGSAGPTTSSRVDVYTPKLLDLGLKGMIGKGIRSQEVKESIIKNKAVYFGAIGGAGALIARSIEKSEVIAFGDLLSEAIRKLYVKDFPLTVLIDCYGNDIYDMGRKKYRIE